MSTSVRAAGAARGTDNVECDKPVVATGAKGQHKRSNKMAGGHSINHLLNFSLPPRQTNSFHSLPRRSRRTAPGYGVWNKEKFVNAQYRFVMKPSGDYTVHFADPDIFFQWQDILQVIIPRISAFASAAGRQDSSLGLDEGHITCPICLSPPSAPRMTKCGHVFCYPCVLHYLSTSEYGNKWNRCPICFDSINESQLKGVKWYDVPSTPDDMAEAPEASSSSSQMDVSGDSFNPGSMLRMRLMERPQITTLALPRSRTWPSEVIPPHQAPFHFLPDVYRFSRFMLATPEYLLANLSRDLEELSAERRILAGMKDDLSVSFVDLAEEKVRRQMEKATALETPELKKAIAHAEQGVRDIERGYQERGRRRAERERNPESRNVGEIPEALLAVQGNVPQPKRSAKPTSTNRGQRTRRNLNPPPPSTSTYYFYQAASGSPIFLHPLDIRILLSHFESYAAFPDTISVRVEASSEGSVDAELRRRCKYLAHMPESADVVFVEADLSSVVGEETIRAFEAPLRARRAKRRERGKKEDRAKQRAEERELQKFRALAAQAPLRPSVNVEDVVAALPEQPPSPENMVIEAASVSEASAQAGAWGQRSFASAAQSTRVGRPPQQAFPQREPQEEDEWDIDAAWHELQRAGGGRRKRANKMVVLGGNGGRRR